MNLEMVSMPPLPRLAIITALAAGIAFFAGIVVARAQQLRPWQPPSMQSLDPGWGLQYQQPRRDDDFVERSMRESERNHRRFMEEWHRRDEEENAERRHQELLEELRRGRE